MISAAPQRLAATVRARAYVPALWLGVVVVASTVVRAWAARFHAGPAYFPDEYIYTELGRSYRLMSEAMERNGLTGIGPPREIYTTDPAQVPDPNDYETVIVWPIGPNGGLESDGDYFFRRVDE